MAPLFSSMGFRVALFNIAYFASSGFNLPYMPVLLRHDGFSDSQIGIILAATLYARVLVLPRIGPWTDGLRNRATAIKLLAVVTLVGVGIFGLTSSFVPVLIAVVMFTLPFQCIGPIGDAIALTMERRGIANYGPLRSIGSASFLICNLGGGLILAQGGATSLYVALFMAFMSMFAAAFVLPPTSGREVALALPSQTLPDCSLWRQRPVMTVMSANALIQASHAVLNSFATLYWQERLFSSQVIGGLWATGVISEIIVFQFIGPRIKHIDPRHLILIGAGIAGLRWTLFPLPFSEWDSFVIQMMHGGSFAIAHLGTMRFIMTEVRETRATAAQGVNVTMGGITMATCTAIAGPLYHNYGGLAFFAMAFPAVAGGVIIVFALRKRRLIPKAGEVADGR